MDLEFVLLNIAVIAAAALQSATGIGFGVIAGPILLIVLNDGSAIQVSIALNLLIAVILAPSLRHNVDRRLLRYLMIGLVIGSPVGLLIFLNIDVNVLKLIAGIGVMLTLSLVYLGSRRALQQSEQFAGRLETVSIGVIAGLMGVCLAMPGPVPAAWMSYKGFDKHAIRSTILAMFVLSYAIALVLQSSMVGIGEETLRLSAALTPATILGIVLGNYLSKRITEKLFRRMLTLVLASTALMLFATLF